MRRNNLDRSQDMRGPMAHHDIVVVGASAGGIEALKAFVAGLPSAFPAALFVVLHIPPYQPSYLPKILERAGHLPAVPSIDGEPIVPGRIYVAPADRSLGHDPSSS